MSNKLNDLKRQETERRFAFQLTCYGLCAE